MESNEKVYILRKNVNIRINNLRGSFFSPPSLCSACLSVNCLRLWQHTDRHEHLHQETHGQRFFFFFSFPIRYRFLSHLIIIIQIASRLGCVRFRSIEFSCFGLIIKSACYYFVQRLFVRVNVKWQTPVEVVYCFNQPHKPLDRLILPMNFVWWLE